MKNILIIGMLLSCIAEADEIFTNEFESLITVRVKTFSLMDPHVFLNLPLVSSCADSTNNSPVLYGTDLDFNAELEEHITSDADMDGFLDINLVSRFSTDQPRYISSRPLNVSISNVDCDTPFSCLIPDAPFDLGNFTGVELVNNCLLVEPGTTRKDYVPSINVPFGPCYYTEPQDVVLELSGLTLPLLDYQESMTYTEGSIQTVSGMHKGFLEEVAAENILIPDNFPLIQGGGLGDLASVLRGHETNCSNESDIDIHPVHGSGWWMYFNSEGRLVETESE